MNIRSEPDVVGQVPAVMIGVIVDDDVVAVPEPVPTVIRIEGGDVEVESAEPEAAWTAAPEVPDVATADPAFKMAMFPGMVEVKVGVVASLVVTDPLAVAVNVRGIGMAFSVAEALFGGILTRRGGVRGWGTVVRYVASSDTMASATVITVLSPKGQRKNERESEELEC